MSDFAKSIAVHTAPERTFAFASDVSNLATYVPTTRWASTDAKGHVHVEGVAHGRPYANDGQIYVDHGARLMRWGSGETAYRGELTVRDGVDDGSEVEIKLHFNPEKGHPPSDAEVERGLGESLAQLKAAVEG